jgi:inositol-phosphate phosphatase/L-galactose 1-phosphate phosphatase/histidinol-phosphatase
MSLDSPDLDPDALLRTAHALADAAAAQSMAHFRTPLDVLTKADESPVTLADRAAETAMRAILGTALPGDGIYGEEHGSERLDARRVWVLDPIDGTRSTGMSIIPSTTRSPSSTPTSVPHSGDPIDGTPVRASGCTRLAEARIVTTSPDIFDATDWRAFDALSRRCAMRRFGGDCYGYAQLAGGTIDLVVETGLQPYDYLGPAGLIEAAGGIVTDWAGRPLGLRSDGRVVAAATPELHRQALDALSA